LAEVAEPKGETIRWARERPAESSWIAIANGIRRWICERDSPLESRTGIVAGGPSRYDGRRGNIDHGGAFWNASVEGARLDEGQRAHRIIGRRRTESKLLSRANWESKLLSRANWE